MKTDHNHVNHVKSCEIHQKIIKQLLKHHVKSMNSKELCSFLLGDANLALYETTWCCGALGGMLGAIEVEIQCRTSAFCRV